MSGMAASHGMAQAAVIPIVTRYHTQLQLQLQLQHTGIQLKSYIGLIKYGRYMTVQSINV